MAPTFQPNGENKNMRLLERTSAPLSMHLRHDSANLGYFFCARQSAFRKRTTSAELCPLTAPANNHQDGSDFKGTRLTVQFARGPRPREPPGYAGGGHHERAPPRPRRTVHRMTITGLPNETSWQVCLPLFFPLVPRLLQDPPGLALPDRASRGLAS